MKSYFLFSRFVLQKFARRILRLGNCFFLPVGLEHKISIRRNLMENNCLKKNEDEVEKFQSAHQSNIVTANNLLFKLQLQDSSRSGLRNMIMNVFKSLVFVRVFLCVHLCESVCACACVCVEWDFSQLQCRHTKTRMLYR